MSSTPQKRKRLPEPAEHRPVQEAVIDADGDLHLLFGGQLPDVSPVRVQVSRTVLRLASRVWRVMLDPLKGWEEGAKREIALPDDDPDILILLLQIAHLNFGVANLDLKRDKIVMLAQTCDKYDLGHLVRPFVKTMIERPNEKIGRERRLFIFRTVGMQKAYEQLYEEIIRKVRHDENGGYYHSGGVETHELGESGLLPLHVIGKLREQIAYMIIVGYTTRRLLLTSSEHIIELRNLVLKGLHNRYYDLAALIRSEGACDATRGRRACNAVSFGSLVFGIGACMNILEPFQNQTIKSSIHSITEAISKFGITSMKECLDELRLEDEYHFDCAFDLDSLAEERHMGSSLIERIKNDFEADPSLRSKASS